MFDLDEAQRYATDALTLGQEEGVPDDITIRAETVIARVADRYPCVAIPDSQHVHVRCLRLFGLRESETRLG